MTHHMRARSRRPALRKAVGQIAFALVALELALLVACASAPPQRYYTLAYTPALAPLAAVSSGSASEAGDARNGRAASMQLVVDPVQLPEFLDRPQIVLRVAPNRVSLLDQDRWAEPLKEQIGRALMADLLRELPGASQARSGTRSGTTDAGPDWRIQVRILQLEARPGRDLSLQAQWTARPARGAPLQEVFQASESLVETPAGAPMEAVVAAHDRILARLAEAMATALRNAAR